MSEAISFQFLGTGTSVGVPQIGCDCKTCTSPDPRDRRRRCGAFVSCGGFSFLIDTPPEMREACVEHGVKKADAVLITHAHMDHIAGFDDVRRFNTLNGEKVPCAPGDPLYRGVPYRIIGKPLNCYALPETIAQMRVIFPYIGVKGGENGLYRPQIEFVENTAPFMLGGVAVEAFRVEHSFPCCGYLLGGDRIAYISDCHDLADAVVERLRGVDTLVLNCLRVREHPTHLSLARSLEYSRRIAPRRTFLTHLCHDLTHAEWLAQLPEGVKPAYDGLILRV